MNTTMVAKTELEKSPLRIVLFSLGTRGDIEPFLALAENTEREAV